MAKSASIEFDEKSLGILKNVDSLHRNSLVNIGLALVSQTGYYRTLAGITPEDLGDVAGLENLDAVIEKVQETKTETKSGAGADWDDEDFF